MTNREKLKPFLWGAVLGGLTLAIVAFSADWIVTSSSRDELVRTAWIDGQAVICATMAQAHRTATADVTSLQGYAARDARDALAKSFAIAMPEQDDADPDVLKACSKLLDKPSV
ncbi:MAG: hypothetical protein EXQ94_02030 [Alphaproteobacteria bacterium]|nr:hypothetical protein [Alphaproteobacteria bacterium]